MTKTKYTSDTESLYPLSERAQTLLKALIERYIQDGEPVGSKLLAKESGLDLSSATIRNVLGDLEKRGLVISPHTSSGRIPTDLGYRLFVDSLVTVKPLEERIVEELRNQLMPSTGSPQALVSSASDILCELTQMASIVKVPHREQQDLRRIEFLPLSENRVLAILVVNECEVENRILHTSRPFSESELLQAANFLNEHFVGKSIKKIRNDLLLELDKTRQSVSNFMATVVDMADKLFPEDQGESLLVAGQTNLMNFRDMADTDKLRQLFESFKHKREILELVDHVIMGEGIKIFIGSESGRTVLGDCSVITAPYSVNKEQVGVLGIIGPRRMAYDNLIPLVDITAKLLSVALQNK